MRNTKKLTVGLAIVTSGLLAGGVAFAAWTSQGAGTGAAQAGTSVDSSITAVTPVTADDLYPGAVKTAHVTISNPNPYPIEVTSINAGYSRAIGSPACPALSVRTDASTATSPAALAMDGGGTVIAPSPGTGTYTLVLRMANDASENCKGKSFVLGGSSTDGTGNITAVIRSAASTALNGF